MKRIIFLAMEVRKVFENEAIHLRSIPQFNIVELALSTTIDEQITFGLQIEQVEEKKSIVSVSCELKGHQSATITKNYGVVDSGNTTLL